MTASTSNTRNISFHATAVSTHRRTLEDECVRRRRSSRDSPIWPYERRSGLRRHFERAGLRDYLQK